MAGARSGPSRRSEDAARARTKIFLIGAVLAAGVSALLLLHPWAPDAPLPAAPPPEEEPAPDAAPAAEEDDEELPESLTRDQVRDVLRPLSPYVKVCGAGEKGVIRVHLDVHGPTGQVKSATVAKEFAGTRTADCTVAVVGAAQFPRFRKRSLTVVFPFTFGEPVDAGPTPDAAAPPPPPLDDERPPRHSDDERPLPPPELE